MRLLSFLFFLLYVSVHSVNAQTFFPIQKEGKWGAIDLNGTVTIEPQYEFISDFNEDNTALFRQAGQYGLVHGEGTVLLTPQYERIDPLQEGLLAVWKGYKVALATRNNQLLTEPVYDVITPIYQNLLRVMQGTQFGVINIEGQPLLEATYSQIDPFKKNRLYTFLKKDEKIGVLSYDGSLLAEAKYDTVVHLPSILLLSITRGEHHAVFFDEEGKPQETKTFPNEVAWQQFYRALENKQRQRILAENPDARKPRWVKVDYRFALQDGTGRNLLGNDMLFYNAAADSATNLAMGKMDGEDGTTRTFLMDDAAVKVLFGIEATDLSLIDYRYGNYARATIDTLWDALVNREGEIIQTLSSSGENFPIHDIGDFYEGLAWFKTNGKYGFVNTDAKVIIPPKYDVVSDFSEGHAIARLNGIYGALNTQGETVIPFEYEGIAPPQKGLFRVKKGKGMEGRWGAVNLKNELVIPYEYQAIGDFVNGEATMVQNGKFGLIDTKGKVLIPAKLEVQKMEPFENGIAWVGRGREVREVAGDIQIIYTKQGYVTRTGSYIIPPDFEYIGDFPSIWKAQKGLCQVRKNGRVGYFDYTGKAVLPTLYLYVDDFETIWKLNKGITKVSNDEKKFGYVNHHGQEVVPVQFEEISDEFLQVYADSSGMALAKTEGKYGYMNYKAEAVIPFAYEALSEFREWVAIAKRGGIWGAINLKNETVVPFKYEALRFLPKTTKPIIQVLNRKQKTYYINPKGQIMGEDYVPPASQGGGMAFNRSDKYDYLWTSTALNIGVVQDKETQALINGLGKLVTKFDFREIREFSEGLAAAQIDAKKVLDRKWGFINPQGEWVIEPVYQRVGDFSNGKAAVMQRQKWGYVDKSGALAIAPQFRSAEPFGEGFAVVDVNTIIDAQGKTVGTFQLEGKISSTFQNGRAVVEDLKGFYHIKPNGVPAYFQRNDAVTHFLGEVAFAKRGELWELTRRTGQRGDFTTKVRFSRGKRNEYLETYGNKRTKDLRYGNAMMDIGWEKIEDGRWKMIGKDGTPLNTVTYESVKMIDNAVFEVSIEQQYGLLNAQGEALTELVYELIRPITSTIIRMETAGKIHYYDVEKNQWLWDE